MITPNTYICRMNKLTDILSGVWLFYYNGFKQMTWGRTLWLIIVLKLFVIFVVLRFCFFRPAMQGLSNDEKSERVGQQLQQK